MTNGFVLNNAKNLQIYFFCVKRQDFLKDVESTEVAGLWLLSSDVADGLKRREKIVN